MTLYELIANKGNYHKAGSRYVGPCPKEGGTEGRSFVTAIGSATGKCFACGWSCDLIGYLMEIEGMGCKQAHLSIGKECVKNDCPAFAKCSGEKPKKKNYLETPVAASPPAHRHQPEAVVPTNVWQEKAAGLVEWAHQQLLANPEQLKYLAGRGLDLAAVVKYRIGYLPEDLFRARSAWGLPEELKENGKAKKFWLPKGIVIPSFGATGTVHRVRIRKQEIRDASDLRYYWLPGSGNDVTILNPGRKALCLIESDLDGLLIDHLAGDIITTIPLGSSTTRPKTGTVDILTAAVVILVALDNDQAGQKNFIWWQENYHQSVWYPVTVGKDPGEAWQKGVDLRTWLLTGLPLSLHPAQTGTKKLATVAAPTAPVPLVYQQTAADGRIILITDDPCEYQRLCGEGKTVFSSVELAAIKAAGFTKQQAARIIDLKEQLKTILTGAVIEELLLPVKGHDGQKNRT